jgi:hypothetical protein
MSYLIFSVRPSRKDLLYIKISSVLRISSAACSEKRKGWSGDLRSWPTYRASAGQHRTPQVGHGSARIVFASSVLRVFAPSRETGPVLISRKAAKVAKPATIIANHCPSISLKRTHDKCPNLASCTPPRPDARSPRRARTHTRACTPGR